MNALYSKTLNFCYLFIYFRFCPSVFIYMMSTVPAIWFLELHELNLRINHQIDHNNTSLNETLEELSANLGSILGVS